MRYKKGLSGIVTTLIIILLVLVAVGVIWGVVNNLLGRSTGTINTATKCLDVDIRATKVVNATATSYVVTLSRKPTGEDEFGAKLVFFSDSANSEPIDFGSKLDPLETATSAALETMLPNANKVEVTPYFNDDSGRDVLCQSTTTFEFE